MAQLFKRHWPEAVLTARAITRSQAIAEDAAQDAFVSAVKKLDTFDQARAFWPWLRRIVVNRAIDLSRQEWRYTELGDRTDDGGIPADPIDHTLMARIRGLDEPHRVVVLLRYGLDLTPTEIAHSLDLPVGTVKSRLSRALDEMRHDLEVSGEHRSA